MSTMKMQKIKVFAYYYIVNKGLEMTNVRKVELYVLFNS